MNDREKNRTEIEARLNRLGETINTLRMKAEQQQSATGVSLGPSLDAIEQKREEVRGSLPQMTDLDEATYAATVDKLRHHLDDIDSSLRQALAHFN
jgi:hypothetical protein